jgi:hypothetical protein
MMCMGEKGRRNTGVMRRAAGENGREYEQGKATSSSG